MKWPKYFFLPIAIKIASIIENGELIIYHQGTKKNFDRKVLVFCETYRKVDFTSDWTSDSTNIGRYGAITRST